MAMFRFDCPACGMAIAVPEGSRKARCPGCRQVVDVPGESPPAVEEVVSPDEPAAPPELAPVDISPPISSVPPRPSGGVPGAIDRAISRVIPARWLATAFVGTAAAAVALLALAIVGLARTPEESAKATVGSAQARLAEVQKLQQAEAEARREAARKAEDLQKELSRTKALLDSAQTARTKAESELADARKQLREAERSARAAAEEVEKKRSASDRERDAAQKEAAALRAKLEKVEAAHAELRRQYEELKASKDAQAKVDERARAAFEGIMKAASGAENLEKKLATMEQLKAASAAELAGTVHAQRLESELAATRRALEEERRLAEARARRTAKETWTEAMRKLKAAATYEKQMAVLAQAKDDLKGTEYAPQVDGEISRRESAHREGLARSAYEEAMRRLARSPSDHEGNLEALEGALGKAAGTRYADILKRQVEARRKTLREDIARTAYEELLARIEAEPTKYEEGIAAAKAALAKAEGTRYAPLVKERLDSLERERREAEGRSALQAARELVAKSKNRAANVASLEELKAKAAGSSSEPAVAKLLERERTLLARERRE